MVIWGRFGACANVTTAEMERDQWMLQTTVGALANQLEAEQRYICAVSQLRAGLTEGQCPKWWLWSSGLKLDILRSCFLLILPLPALLLPPDPLDLTVQGPVTLPPIICT